MRGFPWALGLGLIALVSLYGAPFTVSEEKFEFRVDGSSADVRFEVENPSGSDCQASLRVELEGYAGDVLGADEKSVRIPPGVSRQRAKLALRLDDRGGYDVATRVWDRLRYRVTPEDCAGVEIAEGEVSVSRVKSNLFHLDLLVSGSPVAGRPLPILVRAVQPVTGAGVPGVDVALEVKSQKSVIGTAKARADESGAVELRFEVPPDLKKLRLTATGDYRGLSQKENQRVDFNRNTRVFLQTDKEIYQPGQTLHVRAVAFNAAGEALGGETADVTVRRDGDVLSEQSVKATGFGVIAADWPIPESAELGDYVVEVATSKRGCGGSGELFTVSRYETPPFEVTTQFAEPYFLAGDEVRIQLEARYFFGQPVAGASVEVEDVDGSSIEAELDQQGRASVTLPSGQPVDGKRSFVVEITDPTTARSVQRSVEVPVGESAVEIEIIGGEGFAGKIPRRLSLLARRPDGSPAECELRAVLWPGSDQQVLWRGRTNRLGVAEIERFQVPAEAELETGAIRFEAVGPLGETLGATELEDIGADGEELVLAADRTRYERGQPVELRITSSRPIGSVLVTARDERGRTVMRAAALENGSAKTTLDPDLDFSGVVLIRAESDSHAAADALAVVFPAPEALAVEIAMSKASYKPGEAGLAKVRVRQADGKPVRAAIGLSGVDAAVLALSNSDSAKRDEPAAEELTWRAPSGPDEALLQAALLRRQGRGAIGYGYRGVMREAEDPGMLYAELSRKLLRGVAWFVETAQAEQFPPYPEGLERLLADRDVSLADYRDPWGQPFRPKFAFSGVHQVLHAESAGPDETFGTEDDFQVEVVRWRYFDETRNIIADVLNRAASFPRTREEFFVLLERAGVPRERLTDPWGNLFEPEFSEQRRMVWNPHGGWYGSYDPDPSHYNWRQMQSRQEWAGYPEIMLRSRGDGTTAFAVARFEGSPWRRTPEGKQVVEPRGEPAETAGIRGTVTDSSGAVIPGTEVKLLTSAGEELAETETNERGEYVFQGLSPAFYQLHFYSEGFVTARLFGVPVRDRFMTDAGCWLEVGSVTETVTVEARAATVDFSTTLMAIVAGAAAPLVPRIRKEFLETVLWAPLLETDSKGRVEAPLKLADNITTWSFLAVASTKDGRMAMRWVKPRRAWCSRFSSNATRRRSSPRATRSRRRAICATTRDRPCACTPPPRAGTAWRLRFRPTRRSKWTQGAP